MMLKKLVNILYLLFASAIMLSSQNSFVQKNIPAHYKPENITIDGKLTKSHWNHEIKTQNYSYSYFAGKNRILPDETIIKIQFFNFGQNLKYTFGSSQTNSVSLNSSYYLDYMYLTKIKS